MMVRKEITNFTEGFRAGCAPFQKVMPQLLRSMAVSVVMLLTGAGAIAIGNTMAEPASISLRIIGEGLLIAGAVLGAVASVRAWVVLFRASGFWGNRS